MPDIVKTALDEAISLAETVDQTAHAVIAALYSFRAELFPDQKLFGAVPSDHADAVSKAVAAVKAAA